MIDTIIKGNGKSRTVKAPSDMPADFSTWREQLIAGTGFLDVNLNTATGTDAGCDVVGTPLSKANLLQDDVASELELTPLEATVNDALRALASRGGSFILDITFASALSGLPFTVSGGGFTFSGTVPVGLAVQVDAPYPNMAYTVICDGNYSTVTTTNFFGLYPVWVAPISNVLAENTWGQIGQAVSSGVVPPSWAVGSEKDVVLTTGETLTMQIYGLGHDDLAGGGKARLTFGMKNLMAATRTMNSTNTNVGGYTGSQMYAWLMGTLYPALPADLLAVIKPVVKRTSAGGLSPVINTSSIPIFLLSEIEAFGTTQYSAAGEGTQYPIFTNAASRVKRLANGSGGNITWWCRSPHVGDAARFTTVSNFGDGTSHVASAEDGVCVAFCI